MNGVITRHFLGQYYTQLSVLEISWKATRSFKYFNLRTTLLGCVWIWINIKSGSISSRQKKNSQKYKSRNANKLPAGAWRTLITQWVWFRNVNMGPEYWLLNVGWILSRIEPNIPVFFTNEYGVLANEFELPLTLLWKPQK